MTDSGRLTTAADRRVLHPVDAGVTTRDSSGLADLAAVGGPNYTRPQGAHKNAAASSCEDLSPNIGETNSYRTHSGRYRMSDRPDGTYGNLGAAFGRASSGAEALVRESLNPGWLV